MRKFILSLLVVAMVAPASLFANEGMWFLMHIERLNHRDMQKMGLQLTAEEIYSINNSSLKDAIVQFNGGCTAELISKNGLLLTNHHCGYDKIAELSTPENNYLRDGFWAENHAAELKPKSLFVRFFVRMDDVSERILSKVNDDMSEEERNAAIGEEIKAIQKENDEDGRYTVSVRSFYQGNEFYYFVYEDFTDVRLVGTPTESIGKFGGDTDNWEWPRHTGDFSLFRVYSNKDNEPAEYSADNVPYQPKHHLPVSLKGVKEGDFAMILGYPGRTNRWMAAQGIEQNVKYAYPAWVEGSKTGMDAMKVHMDKDDKVRLDYASKYAGVANYWKNRQGMIDALTQHKTVQTKTKTEKKFDKWANKKENKDYYGNVISDINAYYALTNDKARHSNYMFSMLRTAAMSLLPARLGRQMNAYASADAEQREKMKPALVSGINEMFSSMYMPLEQDVLIAQLNLYANKANYELAPVVQEIATKTDSSFEAYVKSAFALSMFTNPDRLMAFLDFPIEGVIEADPLYTLSMNLIEHYNASTDEIDAAEEKFEVAFRRLVKGLRESGLSPVLYPDANSTLRLTYGTVRALPKDKRNDAKKNFYTTLKGTVAKHKPGDKEFDLSQPLIDLYNEKDFGRYADPSGHMPVNFLTDNDITGGNSGSPVLNGRGELIGLAFDGNIEAMAGDVIFDDKLQRTINVDIRFVLLIIDKYAGATHIIEELTIVE